MKNIKYSEVWGLPVLEIFSQTESHANAKIKQNRVTDTSTVAHENHVDVFKKFSLICPATGSAGNWWIHMARVLLKFVKLWLLRVSVIQYLPPLLTFSLNTILQYCSLVHNTTSLGHMTWHFGHAIQRPCLRATSHLFFQYGSNFGIVSLKFWTFKGFKNWVSFICTLANYN